MAKRLYLFGIGTLILFLVICSNCEPLWADPKNISFAPGEELEYQLRWESITAGSAWLKVLPVKTINGRQAYHFVMIAESNAFVDIFYKVRDRIDAFANLEMSRSMRYLKKQSEGNHKKDEVIEFDWDNNCAHYSNYGKKRNPIPLQAGSFDPLSAFYYTRTMDFGIGSQLERPITDGKKNVIGRMRVVKREIIELLSGQTYDTYLIEPEMNHVSGVFKESKGSKIQLWVTADEKHIPVRIQSKVYVGNFIGELMSTSISK